jgi:amino acid transporter
MQGKLGLWQATSIAVGTMIGASIFSIFGLGARIAGHNLPLVFVLSGALALTVAYSYATLGAKIVSDAGPIEFVLRALGDSVVTGALSILLWLTYVVSIALFAKGFAGYFLRLLGVASTWLATSLVEVGLIVTFMGLGLIGSKTVGRVELLIVAVKLSVLGLFVVLGLWTVNPEWITPRLTTGQGASTLDAMAVFFLSYMGFGLVTNASEHIQDPERNVPKAIYLSILIVTVVYVSVAVVAVGNLQLSELVRAQDYALAEAARPFLGRLGYLFVSLGALFSIASALNATLYGGGNIAYALAKDGQLPRFFERRLWFGSPEGLYLTVVLGIAFALVFDLSGVASLTSAIFMVIYLFVLVSHFRLAGTVGGSRTFILASIVVISAVFLILLRYEWQTNRAAFVGTWLALLASLTVELVYRRMTGRTLLARAAPDVDVSPVDRR